MDKFDLKSCVFSIADNLPVATRLEFYSNREEEEKKKEKDVQFEHGYRLGFMDGNKVENPGAVQGVPGGALGVCQRVLEVYERVSGLGMQPKGFVKSRHTREKVLTGRRGWVLACWYNSQVS